MLYTCIYCVRMYESIYVCMLYSHLLFLCFSCLVLNVCAYIVPKPSQFYFMICWRRQCLHCYHCSRCCLPAIILLFVWVQLLLVKFYAFFRRWKRKWNGSWCTILNKCQLLAFKSSRARGVNVMSDCNDGTLCVANM